MSTASPPRVPRSRSPASRSRVSSISPARDAPRRCPRRRRRTPPAAIAEQDGSRAGPAAVAEVDAATSRSRRSRAAAHRAIAVARSTSLRSMSPGEFGTAGRGGRRRARAGAKFERWGWVSWTRHAMCARPVPTGDDPRPTRFSPQHERVLTRRCRVQPAPASAPPPATAPRRVLPDASRLEQVDERRRCLARRGAPRAPRRSFPRLVRA